MAEVVREIRRDPFARTTLLRRTVTCGHAECVWCGSRRGRFFYRWVSDTLNGRFSKWFGPFCNIGCYRAYTE